MRKCYIIIIFLLGMVVTLSMVRAVLHNTLSTSGILVNNAEKEINFYKTQNAILSEKLLTVSSLTNIAKKAEISGFTSENTLMILKASRPLAARP